jgi:dipeptidyl aminopeptidase/acylaminoacyl peptidase
VVRRTLVFFLLLAAAARAQDAAGYRPAPPAIKAVLDTQPTPTLSISPARDRGLLIHGERHPPISAVAAPMLRLAGLRVDPNTNGPHLPPRVTGLSVLNLADGSAKAIDLPKGGHFGQPVWSPDGRHFAFSQTLDAGIILWIGDSHAASAAPVKTDRKLNAVIGPAFEWLPDGKTLLCHTIVPDRGPPPQAPRTPAGPVVQESSGRAGPVRTFQDLLRNKHDEDLFDFYATSQIVLLDATTGDATPLGKPGVFPAADVSPDGRYFLVTRLHKPYSYLHPAGTFPKDMEIWDRRGEVVHKLASLPLADRVPIEGVPTGPRAVAWRPTEPATLVWAEALDGGDPKKKVEHRDHVLMLKAPFRDEPGEVARTQHRFAGLSWTPESGVTLLRDYDRDRRWNRTFLLSADVDGKKPRLVHEGSAQDRYHDPGQPLTRLTPDGRRVLWQSGGGLFLVGSGASPQGDRPFLDRLDIANLKTTRLFQCPEGVYESVVGLLAEDGSTFVTRRESPTEPPNYFVRIAGEKEAKALTKFTDPAPALRGIKQQLVTFERGDGVKLSMTLYLPPDYQAGTRLPTVLWAYPQEFNDAGTAGQVTGSPHRFVTIGGYSHLFFLTQGYAVIECSMPVVGGPETANDTFIEQIVANAKAAIDKAAELGVTDPKRVGVGGHSYGAFMTAHLLANSDLFRAGIARSGAYNRTLTPFGFQNERRTLWESPQLYVKMSPLLAAQRIKAPILLIHGEADNNAGTFPMQSERLYQAIRGNGGSVRYVVLPHEAHGYVARESVEHVLAEMIDWFDRHVKNAPTK